MAEVLHRRCPNCKRELPALKPADWDCPWCSVRIVVRWHRGTLWLLTAEAGRAWDNAPPLPDEDGF
jgi:hypothetical protein